MALTNGPSIKVDIRIPSRQLNFGKGDLWQKRTLMSATIMQSFTVDYKGEALYIAQCENGSRNPDRGATQGDVLINRVDYTGTRKKVIACRHADGWNGKSSLKYNKEFSEYNYVKEQVRGFGHGTQIALEYAPDGTYLWLDYDSPCVDRMKDHQKKLTDYYVVGKRLARIPTTGGATFKPDDPRLSTFTLTKRIKNLTDSDFATVSIDNVNRLLAVKYTNEKHKMMVTLFKITYTASYASTKRMGDIEFTELTTFAAPSVRWPKAANVGWGRKSFGNLIPNGWAIFGDYVYFLAGTAYWAKTEQSGQTEWYSPTPNMLASGCYKFEKDGTFVKETNAGNAHVICYNWKTGESDVARTEAGRTLRFREPEGMSVVPVLDDAGNVKALRLLMGFAGGSPGKRHWSVFEKKMVF